MNSYLNELKNIPSIHREDVEAIHFGKEWSLHDYQVDGIKFIVERIIQHKSCILADVMGLGKTLQSIGSMKYIELTSFCPQMFLVICPLSVITNWSNSLGQFYPEISFTTFLGSSQERVDTMKNITSKITNFSQPSCFHVLLCTYEMLLLEPIFITKYANHSSFITIDEAHHLKNNYSKCYNFVQTFSPDIPKLLLTGTPVQNNLKELFNLLNLCLPSHLWQELPSLFHDSPNNIIDKEAFLSLIILRRGLKDASNAWNLPSKEEIVLFLPPTRLQATTYIRVLSGEPGYNGASGNKTLGLVKACIHPYLFTGVEPEPYEEGEHIWKESSKFGALMNILKNKIAGQTEIFFSPNYKGSKKTQHFKRKKRILIFSSYTQCLDIIQDCLDFYNRIQEIDSNSSMLLPYCRLDGSIRGSDRANLTKSFEWGIEDDLKDEDASGDRPLVMLLSTRAGGEGLNLTAASNVVFMDSDWNPQKNIQALARSLRQGQRAEKVIVYRLCVMGSVDSIIWKRARAKELLFRVELGKGSSVAEDELDITRPMQLGDDSLVALSARMIEELQKDTKNSQVVAKKIEVVDTKDAHINKMANEFDVKNITTITAYEYAHLLADLPYDDLLLKFRVLPTNTFNEDFDRQKWTEADNRPQVESLVENNEDNNDQDAAILALYEDLIYGQDKSAASSILNSLTPEIQAAITDAKLRAKKCYDILSKVTIMCKDQNIDENKEQLLNYQKVESKFVSMSNKSATPSKINIFSTEGRIAFIDKEVKHHQHLQNTIWTKTNYNPKYIINFPLLMDQILLENEGIALCNNNEDEILKNSNSNMLNWSVKYCENSDFTRPDSPMISVLPVDASGSWCGRSRLFQAVEHNVSPKCPQIYSQAGENRALSYGSCLIISSNGESEIEIDSNGNVKATAIIVVLKKKSQGGPPIIDIESLMVSLLRLRSSVFSAEQKLGIKIGIHFPNLTPPQNGLSADLRRGVEKAMRRCLIGMDVNVHIVTANKKAVFDSNITSVVQNKADDEKNCHKSGTVTLSNHSLPLQFHHPQIGEFAPQQINISSSPTYMQYSSEHSENTSFPLLFDGFKQLDECPAAFKYLPSPSLFNSMEREKITIQSNSYNKPQFNVGSLNNDRIGNFSSCIKSHTKSSHHYTDTTRFKRSFGSILINLTPSEKHKIPVPLSQSYIPITSKVNSYGIPVKRPPKSDTIISDDFLVVSKRCRRDDDNNKSTTSSNVSTVLVDDSEFGIKEKELSFTNKNVVTPCINCEDNCCCYVCQDKIVNSEGELDFEQPPYQKGDDNLNSFKITNTTCTHVSTNVQERLKNIKSVDDAAEWILPRCTSYDGNHRVNNFCLNDNKQKDNMERASLLSRHISYLSIAEDVESNLNWCDQEEILKCSTSEAIEESAEETVICTESDTDRNRPPSDWALSLSQENPVENILNKNEKNRIETNNQNSKKQTSLLSFFKSCGPHSDPLKTPKQTSTYQNNSSINLPVSVPISHIESRTILVMDAERKNINSSGNNEPLVKEEDTSMKILKNILISENFVKKGIQIYNNAIENEYRVPPKIIIFPAATIIRKIIIPSEPLSSIKSVILFEYQIQQCIKKYPNACIRLPCLPQTHPSRIIHAGVDAENSPFVIDIMSSDVLDPLIFYTNKIPSLDILSNLNIEKIAAGPRTLWTELRIRGAIECTLKNYQFTQK